MSRTPILHRPRRSTVIIGVIWMLTCALYLVVRPDPGPQTELVPAVRVPVTETPATTAPPEPTEPPTEATELPGATPESPESTTTTTEPAAEESTTTTTTTR